MLRRMPLGGMSFAGRPLQKHHPQERPAAGRGVHLFRLLGKLLPLRVGEPLEKTRFVLLGVAIHPAEQGLAILGVRLFLLDQAESVDPRGRLQAGQGSPVGRRQPAEPMGIVLQRIAEFFGLRILIELLLQLPDVLLLGWLQAAKLLLTAAELLFLGRRPCRRCARGAGPTIPALPAPLRRVPH